MALAFQPLHRPIVFLVGAFFGIEALGAYAVAVSLAIVTMSPLYAICSSLGVSILARNKSSRERSPASVYGRRLGLRYFRIQFLCRRWRQPRSACAGDLRSAVFRGARGPDCTRRDRLVRILRGPASVLLLVQGDARAVDDCQPVGGVGFGLAALFVKALPTLESMLAGILVGDVLCFALLQNFVCRQLPQVREPSRALFATEAGMAVGLLVLLSITSSAGLGERAIVVALSASATAWMAWANTPDCTEGPPAPAL